MLFKSPQTTLFALSRDTDGCNLAHVQKQCNTFSVVAYLNFIICFLLLLFLFFFCLFFFFFFFVFVFFLFFFVCFCFFLQF